MVIAIAVLKIKLSALPMNLQARFCLMSMCVHTVQIPQTKDPAAGPDDKGHGLNWSLKGQAG